MQARAEAIGAAISALDAARPDLVLDGELGDVVAHDAQRARLTVELEQCSARLGRLDGERAEAEREEDQARRRATYAAAKRRRAEGVAALIDYERHARGAADALMVLAAVEAQIADANDDDLLPTGAALIEPAEPSNAVAPTPDTWHPPQRIQPTITDGRRGTVPMHDSYMTAGYTTYGSPGQPHCSILQRARIAGLRPNEMLYPPTPGVVR